VLPSKSQINKCGKLLKRVEHEGYAATAAEVASAYSVLEAFRGAHAYPMLKTRMGLASFCRTVGAREAVTQRLKRTPRIVRKLHRMPAMPLANLEDVGGVRAVLKDGPELDRVLDRIRRVWGNRVARERDYIAVPKDIGYRAVHLVVERDDRAIELQLRTQGQQEWAQAVENADDRLGLNLKDGSGPPEMIEYFSAAGEVIFLVEYAREIPPALTARLGKARQAVIEAGYYTQ
jgi:hypothetical protein